MNEKYSIVEPKYVSIDGANQKKTGRVIGICENKFFSNLINSDTFKLTIGSGEIAKSRIHFQIVDFKGKEIFSTNFKSVALVGYSFMGKTGPSELEQDSVIVLEMNRFFDLSRFSKPAISIQESYDIEQKELVPIDLWNSIQSDSNAIGFLYGLWEGEMYSIAFSRKSDTVVVYRYCC